MILGSKFFLLVLSPIFSPLQKYQRGSKGMVLSTFSLINVEQNNRLFKILDYLVTIIIVIKENFHSQKMPRKQSFYFRPLNINLRMNMVALAVSIIFQSLISIGTCTIGNINYIINGNFSQPALISDRHLYFPSTILGWQCTWLCEIKNCIKQREFWLPQNKIASDCIGQVIDLDSNIFNEKVTQRIQLNSGFYSLHFNYYLPHQKANLKQLQVSFNNDIIFTFQPQVSAGFETLQYSTQVQAKEGSNSLQFANLGDAPDGYGFKINNVSLVRQINDVLEQSVDSFFETCKYTNMAPGARVIFRSTLSFLLNFDRYELYIYHKRLYSYNEKQFILSVNQFLATKGTLVTSTLEKISDQEAVLQEMVKSNKYKEGYVSYPSFSEDYRQADYLDNLNESFVKMLVFLVAFTVVLKVLFRVSFHKPVSLLFAKFDFWPIVLIMMFDGNIEMLTFCTFAEFKSFFSKGFGHKVLNAFVAMFFFLTLFYAFALSFWIKVCYRKRAKYLLDEGQSKLCILWGIAVDRGVICFLFGAVHQLLLEEPTAQLALLGILQVLWIIKKVVYVRNRHYREKLLAATSVVSGVLRVAFQLGAYLYEQRAESRLQLNEQMHAFVIYAIIAAALLEFVVGFAECLLNLVKIWRINSPNRVQSKHSIPIVKEANILDPPKIQEECEKYNNSNTNGRLMDKNYYIFLRKNRPIKITKFQFQEKMKKFKFPLRNQ